MDTDNNIIAFVERKHGNRYRLDADDPVFMAATIVEGVVGEAQKKALAEITKLVSGFADQIATASVLADNSAKARAEATVTAAAQWAAEHIKAAGVDAGNLAAGPLEAALERAERSAPGGDDLSLDRLRLCCRFGSRRACCGPPLEMALQLGATCDAFLAAGVSAAQASAAAEELAGFDHRIAAIDSRLAVLTWMVGAVLGLSLVLLGSAFALWSQLAQISGQLARLAPH